MASKNLTFKENELLKSCDFIAKLFAANSWWPCEQPGEAKREFDLMKGSPSALNEWCKGWLNDGQSKKLELSLRS